PSHLSEGHCRGIPRAGVKLGVRRSALPVQYFPTAMISEPSSALLVVGHGSTVNPDSSAPTWTHAREIQRRNIFAEVQCAFWKEEPSLRDARFFFPDDTIGEVFVVPNFISEGYFTQRSEEHTSELQSRENLV